MSPADTLRLLLLSSLWGFSFIFMRVAVPEFGALALMLVRMVLGTVLLLPLLLRRDYFRLLRLHAGPLFVVGLMNAALPYTFLALATLRLEAGVTSLINAATPICTALIGAAFFATPIMRQQVLGLALAFAGVGVLSAGRLDFSAGGDGWFILSALGATLCYGFAGNYSRTHLAHLPTRVLAAGTCATSSVILLLPGLLLWPAEPLSGMAWGAALGLGAISTAAALLLYFGLLASAGATASSTVTLLVPISALVWGFLLLQEPVTLQVLAGMAITLLGTGIATGVLKRGRKRALG
ncbi:MAG: DMT family transporter [Haliea sp.]|jgi:drug/metabolite transporter (DMT)-like permease|nr:DMT family transporter [Haliea sp.]